MFQFDLHKNSGVSTAWLLSTIGSKCTGTNRRVKKRDILGLRVSEVCSSIAKTTPYMLRVSSSLMYGTVLIYDRQVGYLRDEISNLRSSIVRQNWLQVTAEKPFDARTDLQLENDPQFDIERLMPNLPLLDGSPPPASSWGLRNTSIDDISAEMPNETWEVGWDAFVGVDDFEPMEFVFDEQGDISHNIEAINTGKDVVPRELSALPEVTEPVEGNAQQEGPPRKRQKLALVGDLDNQTTFSHTEYRAFYDNYLENMATARAQPRSQRRENIPVQDYTCLLLGEPFIYAFPHYGVARLPVAENVVHDAPVVPSTPASVEIGRQRAGSIEHLSGSSRASFRFSFDIPRPSSSPLAPRRTNWDDIVPMDFYNSETEEGPDFDDDPGVVNKELAVSMLNSIIEPTLFSDLSRNSNKSEKVSLFYQLLCQADKNQVMPDQLPNGDIMILLV
ncbi:hypothetical protein TRVA0_007S03730 [Trichomonascus vanleenenianus]|uniref:Rec8p n=1 Tax=Trichomonascus vanleenenianus TaxID=2268995 RepID=UPI003ECB1694